MEFDKAFFDWVDAHINDNTTKLRLKFGNEAGGNIDYPAAITQIECRRKFKIKLNETLSLFPDLYFPNMLAGEQSTSDLLAEYHASLVDPGASVADLTAGLGIDVFHLSRRASEVYAVELDEMRAAALKFNRDGLGITNIEIISEDCHITLKNAIAQGNHFDYVFIDPARRAVDGKRVYALSDCQPDVVAMLPELKQVCSKLIIKASPMLDISHTVQSLGRSLICARAVGTPTDCKELLLTVDFNQECEEPLIESVIISTDGIKTVSYLKSEETNAPMPGFNRAMQAGDYIFEPYPEVMKTGMFKLLASRYGLSIIHPNTRLFYSSVLANGFPGRIFKVKEVLPYASKIIKRLKKQVPTANIATRNFGMTADTLRTKLGITDGGELRLYGYTDSLEKRMLALAEPIAE